MVRETADPLEETADLCYWHRILNFHAFKTTNGTSGYNACSLSFFLFFLFFSPVLSAAAILSLPVGDACKGHSPFGAVVPWHCQNPSTKSCQACSTSTKPARVDGITQSCSSICCIPQLLGCHPDAARPRQPAWVPQRCHPSSSSCLSSQAWQEALGLCDPALL